METFIERFVVTQTGGDRSGWEGVFAGLKPAMPILSPDPDDYGSGVYVEGRPSPHHLNRTMEALEADGRFSILDTSLTDADKAEIAVLNSYEAGQRINALRDHLNAAFTVSMADQHQHRARAEQVARYMGDVTNAWVEGQISEQLEMAEEFSKTFAQESAELDTRHAEAKEMLARARESNDPEQRREAFSKLSEVSSERAALAISMNTFAKSVAQARAAALTDLMTSTVSSYEPVPVGDIAGQKKALGTNLAEVSSLFPDAWKHNTLGLSPLIIRPSKARAHYCANSPVRKQGYAAYVSDIASSADYSTPTSTVIPSRRRYEDVETLMGGDPDNPEHVNIMEKERDRLNELDKQWIAGQNKRFLNSRRKAPPRWEVFTNDYGVLALRETFPSGMRTVGYESVIRVDTDKSTLVHELSHRMEDGNPHLRAVCEEFIRRRTTDENGVQESPTRYAKDTEPVFKDELTHTYIGKMYPRKHTEVLSIGMEMLMYGKFGAGIGLASANESHLRKDPSNEARVAPDQEHMNLIMGLLMSAPRTEDVQERSTA